MGGRIFYQVGGALLWWVSVDIPESCFPLFCLQCQSRASDHLILSESCQEKGSLGLQIRGFIFPTGKVASLFTDSSSKNQLFLQGIFIYPATERPVYKYITSRGQCCVGRKKECRPYELQDTFHDQWVTNTTLWVERGREKSRYTAHECMCLEYFWKRQNTRNNGCLCKEKWEENGNLILHLPHVCQVWCLWMGVMPVGTKLFQDAPRERRVFT